MKTGKTRKSSRWQLPRVLAGSSLSMSGHYTYVSGCCTNSQSIYYRSMQETNLLRWVQQKRFFVLDDDTKEALATSIEQTEDLVWTVPDNP